MIGDTFFDKFYGKNIFLTHIVLDEKGAWYFSNKGRGYRINQSNLKEFLIPTKMSLVEKYKPIKNRYFNSIEDVNEFLNNNKKVLSHSMSYPYFIDLK